MSIRPESPGVACDSSAVAHLVALGYEDPLEAAQLQAAAEQSQRLQLQTAEQLLRADGAIAAIELLESIIAAAPDWPAPRHLLARAYFRSGRLHDAASSLEWLESRGVEHAELTLLRARLALRARSFAAARDHADYAQALHPGLAAADAISGEVAFRTGDLAAAERAYRRAADVAGPQPAAWAGLAAVALRRGELAEAIECSLQAVEQAPSVASTHYRLGLALYRLQRPQEAKAALEAAAALNPQLWGPYRWLRAIAVSQGDRASAERYEQLGRAVIARRRSARCSATSPNAR
jgi:tetratricopeptide (TPR) repeat protein